ncbi:MAG TPA: MBL fold metallo-hydrolase [Pirellulales bacterium]|nr:MBL fold metallo-hydrolase [Pirellulales bacterium]
MNSANHSQDLRGQLVFLGTGTSVGIPMIGCGCAVCTSADPRNQRTRCGVVWGLPEGNLLIDTPPELRIQLIREKIGLIHALAYTHDHADHVFGLDDTRMFGYYLGHALPVYCEEQVETRLRKAFDYCFVPRAHEYAGGVPQLELCRIGLDPFPVLGAQIIPLRLEHGRFRVLGFRVGNVAYCTDTNHIPAESWPLLADLDVLVLDALRAQPHPTHFSLEEAVAVIERLRPKQSYLTHISHALDHAAVEASLPAHIRLAYDGLRIPLH